MLAAVGLGAYGIRLLYERQDFYKKVTPGQTRIIDGIVMSALFDKSVEPGSPGMKAFDALSVNGVTYAKFDGTADLAWLETYARKTKDVQALIAELKADPNGRR